MICSMLNCGSLDLEMLDKCNYDYDDIKDDFCAMKVKNIDFNTLLASCLNLYINHIQEKIDEKITETESDLKELERYIDENNGNVDIQYIDNEKRLNHELEELQSICAYDDIEYNTNYLDTNIYIVDDEIRAIYQKYLEQEIENENEQLGFCSLEL